jgi:transposase
VISCYEAGYDGFWLHRQLSTHGIRNYVIDPASLQVDRRARRVKTDRIDTERLLRSLMAYLRGEPKVWSVVRVPSVAEEDARRLHRERDRLVCERVQHVNRIKGLCALQGIYDYNPLRPQSMAGLEQLRTTQGGALPPRLKSEIKRELQRLELVVEMIATLEAERNAIVEDEASTLSTQRKSTISISSRRSVRSLPWCWLARYSIVTSTIAANWRVMSVSRRARSRAEMWRMTKGSARLATARGEPPESNSPGCGCAINPTAI